MNKTALVLVGEVYAKQTVPERHFKNRIIFSY